MARMKYIYDFNVIYPEGALAFPQNRQPANKRIRLHEESETTKKGANIGNLMDRTF